MTLVQHAVSLSLRKMTLVHRAVSLSFLKDKAIARCTRPIFAKDELVNTSCNVKKRLLTIPCSLRLSGYG